MTSTFVSLRRVAALSSGISALAASIAAAQAREPTYPTRATTQAAVGTRYPVEVTMTRRFVPLPRAATLSVVITLLAAPIASAQSPEAAPAIAAPAHTVLLNESAFARLVQQAPADVAPAPVVKAPPRLDLLRQGTTAMARQAQTAPAKAAQQKSWLSRHKRDLIVGSLIAVGVIFGFLAAAGGFEA